MTRLDDAERVERYGKIVAEDYWLKDSSPGFTLPMVLQSRFAFPELRRLLNERRKPTR